MDNLLNDFLVRLKAAPFAQPGAERGFLITRRGKGLRQLFNFQLVNGAVNELAFTNTREPALPVESDTLDESFVLQTCGNKKFVTGTYVNYFDVVALRDILLAMVPLNIVVSFANVDYNRFGLTGYMVHEGVYIRVEMYYSIPKVGQREAGLSRLMIEEALRREDLDYKGSNQQLVDNGIQAGRVLRDVALARAAQISQGVHPADAIGGPDGKVGVIAQHGTAVGKSRPTHELMGAIVVEPDAVDETRQAETDIGKSQFQEVMTAGVSGCAMAPTMGMGLNSELQPELQATGMAEAAKLDHPTA